MRSALGWALVFLYLPTAIAATVYFGWTAWWTLPAVLAAPSVVVLVLLALEHAGDLPRVDGGVKN